MTRGWRETTLGAEIDLVYGKGLREEDRRPGSVPVFGSNGRVGWHQQALVEGPGIVVGRKGSLGAVAFCEGPFWPIDTTYYVRNTVGHDWRFLHYLLQHLRLDQLNSDTAVPGLKRETALSLTVIMPPHEEQVQIGDLLWRTDHALEIEDQIITATRELKRAAMYQLFTRGLREENQKDTEIGPVPAHWELVRIGDVMRLVTGGTPDRSVPAYWQGGSIPWVKTAEIDYSRITDTEEAITAVGLEESAAKLLPLETVLIAMYGQGVTRGKVAILGIEAATNQACVGLIGKDDSLTPLFVYYYLAHSYDRLRGLAHGAQQQNLSKEIVASFPIPRPEQDEQQEVVQILGALDAQMGIHRKKRGFLDDLFETLLHNLMTGRLRVRDTGPGVAA